METLNEVDFIKDIFRIHREANKAEAENKSKEQKILEELCVIKGFTRATIWELDYSIFNKQKARCEIIAGVPLDRNEHGFEDVDPISMHDDLAHILDLEDIFVEKDPKTSKYTKYFKPAILDNNISQILYVPFFQETPKRKIKNILVVDATGERAFTNEEKEFCKIVGQLVSILIIEREDSIQKTRDEIYQQIVSMVGSLKKLQKYGFKMIGYASSIVGESEQIPELLRKLLNKFVEHGYKMMEFASGFLDAFSKIKKKIPQKKEKFNKKES